MAAQVCVGIKERLLETSYAYATAEAQGTEWAAEVARLIEADKEARRWVMSDDLQQLVQRATAVTGKVQTGLDTLAGEVTALLGSLTRLPAGVSFPRSSAASQLFNARTDFSRAVPQHVPTWAPTCQALTNLGDAARVFREYATQAAEPITSEFEIHRMSAGRSGWVGPASDVYDALVADDHLIAFNRPLPVRGRRAGGRRRANAELAHRRAALHPHSWSGRA